MKTKPSKSFRSANCPGAPPVGRGRAAGRRSASRFGSRIAWSVLGLGAAACVVWVGVGGKASGQERPRRGDFQRSADFAPAPGTRPTTAPTTAPSAAIAAVSGPRATGRSATGRSATGPSAAPSSAPSARPAAPTPPIPPPDLTMSVKPLPQTYTILLYRSVFTKERPRSPGGPVATAPPPSRNSGPENTTPQQQETIRKERTFALKGIADVDGELLAWIEDPSAKKTLIVKEGDPLVIGKVKSLTLDGLEYEKEGKVQRIDVGQNLRGEVVAVASDTSTASAGTPAAAGATSSYATPTTASPSAPAAGGSSSEDDVLKRLRERRAREGG